MVWVGGGRPAATPSGCSVIRGVSRLGSPAGREGTGTDLSRGGIAAGRCDGFTATAGDEHAAMAGRGIRGEESAVRPSGESAAQDSRGGGLLGFRAAFAALWAGAPAAGRARWGAWHFHGMQRSGAKPEHVAWFADDSPGEIACSNRRMTADAQNDSRGRPLRLPIIGGLNFRKTPRLGLYPIVRNTR